VKLQTAYKSSSCRDSVQGTVVLLLTSLLVQHDKGPDASILTLRGRGDRVGREVRGEKEEK